MSEKLKPCPFNEDHEIMTDLSAYDDNSEIVKCRDCETNWILAENWNTRPEEERLRGLLEEIKLLVERSLAKKGFYGDKNKLLEKLQQELEYRP